MRCPVLAGLIAPVIFFLSPLSSTAQETSSGPASDAVGGANSTGSADDAQIEALRNKLTGQQEDWVINNQLGVVYATQGRFNEALRSLESAAMLNSKNGRVVLNMSIIYERLGRLDDALNAARRAESLAPALVDAKREVCSVLAARKDMVLAADCYEELVRISDDASDHARFVYTLTSSEQNKRAEAAAERAVTAFPKNADIINSIGITHYNQRRYKEAAIDFRRAIEINGATDALRFNLAVASIGSNDRSSALQNYSLIKTSDHSDLADRLYKMLFRNSVLGADDLMKHK